MQPDKIGFTYQIEHLDPNGLIKSVETVHNIIPTVGLNYLLGASFTGVSPYTSWYLSLYGANRTPLAADTMSTLMADCLEDTTYTVTSGQRPLITFGAIAAGEVEAATANEFDFVTGATIYGAFITTNITRGNDAGLLVSAVLFPTPKTPAAGESLRVPVGFSFYSV